MDDELHTLLLNRTPSPRRQGFSRNSLIRFVENQRSIGRAVLSSHKKHYVVMLIVLLDVVALLANVFIQLIACELHELNKPWVQKWKQVLEHAGLVFSSLFMVELLWCFFSFGVR